MRWDRRQRLVVYTLAFLVLLAILAQRGLYKGGVFREGRFNDFRAYHLAATGLWSGDLGDAYRDDKRPYQYPPTFAVIVSPLGWLSYRAAAAVWVLAKIALLVFCFRSLDDALAIPFSGEAKLFGFLLAFRYVEGDFANGNANLVVLAFLVAGAVSARRSRTTLAGVLFAIATLIKLTPLLCVLWFAYRLRLRLLVSFLIGLVVFGLAAPAVFLGPRGAFEAWGDWYEGTLAPAQPFEASYREEPGAGYMPGQGIRALSHRLLRDSDATAHDETVASVHWFDLSKRSADAVYGIAGLALVCVALFASWKRAPGIGGFLRAEELASLAALAALLGPLSRKAHFVLIWPAAVLAFVAWQRAEAPRLRRYGGILWGAALVLVVASSPGVLGRTLSTIVQAYCPATFATLLLLLLILDPRLYPRTLPGGEASVASVECGGREG